MIRQCPDKPEKSMHGIEVVISFSQMRNK